MEMTFYPKSPVHVPEKLTALPSSYQFRAFLAILAIVLFFVLYAALVISLGFLVYYSIMYGMGSVNRFSILIKIGAIAGAVMLFLFTLKFIFKLKNPKPENRIKLPKKEYPELWEFVYRICEETGAPKPKTIFADPDVNAYVAYSNIWLSLFLPVRKELTIGLGLVDCVNLSEFKAVVSHEFGHFAQRSMKIGSYIHSANTIIHDMIFSRDKWDEILDRWRASDIRLSAAAWVITPVIWVIRQVLNLFYQFLNIMHSSLSREMEFNADKVAVSTSGSEAIISALWKLNDGAVNWNGTVRHAYMASQKQIFTKNLYVHNGMALDRIAESQKAHFESLPADERGGRLFFQTAEDSKVGMYASHPPNDQRENSAKIPFVPCEADERSPWILFPEKEGLQEKMTVLLYNKYINKVPQSEVAIDEFENFIQSETKGAELLAEYHNTFQNRFFFIPTEEEMEAAILKMPAPSVEDLQKLKAELLELMKPIAEIENLMARAQQISAGTTKEKSFSFEGKEYDKKTLAEGYNLLMSKREEIFASKFKAWDTTFCSLHMALARKTDKGQGLTRLYEQHRLITELYLHMVNVKATIFGELNDIQARNDVTEVEVSAFGRRVKNLILSINDTLKKFDDATFVPLSNIDDVREFKEAIVEDGEFKNIPGSLWENDGFNKMVGILENGIVHAQRVEQKSVSEILLYHKEVL
ncbi:MAG: hypothetical protein DWQ02_11780 [Bacteroidetes bacterium]|nr:MAG: hypothetical protein DWQ02_11780 [Bacteroidota bacterium]